MKTIYQVYAPETDTTIVFEDTHQNGTLISTEVKGFYFGEPDDEGLATYYGKLKATFN